MSLKERFDRPRKKEWMVDLAEEISISDSLIEELVNCLIQKDDKRLAEMAAFTMQYLTDINANLLIPYLDRLLPLLGETGINAVKRTIIRLLQYIDVPVAYREDVLEAGFRFLADPKESIAVKAFSMTALYNVCIHYKELQDELAEQIRYQMELPTASPGIRSRGRSILRKLDKI